MKSWVVVYKQHGRMRRLTLGRYPILSLADARQKAKEALARVTQGEDPAEEKQAERAAPTFKKLVEVYMERHAKARKRSWREDERMLAKYIPASWAHRPATSITRAEVRELLADLADRAPIQANRLLSCLSKLFNVAMRWDLVAVNPERVVANR